MDYNSAVITIVEVQEFQRAAASLLSPEEHRSLINYLAANPKAGDLIRGTGGVRKLRWAYGSRGKSSGVRVIYYVHSDAMPLYLLTMFGKNERANLSAAQRNALAGMVDELVAYWLRR